MSSIIVLDSSSDEDESPPKKANLKSTQDYNNPSSKHHSSKQRTIPSGITITPRHSPVTQGAKTPTTATKPIPAEAGNINHAITNIINHTITNIINHERQTPTPPKAQGNLSAQTQRKRKTPTPPQAMPRLAPKPFASMSASNIMSPAAAATTMAPLPPIMPMITGVHSMAAGSTPPLQLMATPPHNLGAFAGLNEQMMINPHLIHTNLPPNTTITAHPNPNQNNINNNFKIHLPPKPVTTPSPAASPASSAPKTPSPQLAASPVPGRADKSTKRINPTTIMRSSDEAWLLQRNKLQSQFDRHNSEGIVEMLPPTMESPKSASRHHTPMTSPSTPKSHKTPDVILVSTTKPSGDVLDLTGSVDNISMSPNIIDLVDTPPSDRTKHMNGNEPSKKHGKPSGETNGKSAETVESNKEKDKDKPPPKPALEADYEELIKVCREADKSDDMEKLIKNKLIKYYYDVHADFVKSKSFRKSIRKVVEAIRAEPDLVYYNLKTIVEELKVRRKAKVVEVPVTPPVKTEGTAASTTPTGLMEDSNSTSAATTSSNNIHASPATVSAISSSTTGNKKLDEQIKKLNKALYVLTKRIEVLEQSEVDWDDEDSSFLQVERFKKRACQIYEKICDLTGESKNAHRLVKKPIKFNETRIPQFNKTLQAFINRTKEFPDYFDVLRMLEHCNRTYDLGLVNFEIKNIAEDAFIKVGKLLQKRRKADLYETVTHYGGSAKDPAQSDPTLAAKLNENQKNHKKISEILEKFARKQDMPDEEEEEIKADSTVVSENKKSLQQNEEDVTNNAEINTETIDKVKLETIQVDKSIKDVTLKAETAGDDSGDDDDDDEEDEDEEVNLEEHVETLAAANGDVSDNDESDNDENKEDKRMNLARTDSALIDQMQIVDDAVDVPEVLNFEQICDTLQTVNNNIENSATKTANTKDCQTPPNGKLKESTKLNICTTTSTTSPHPGSTTTATADLKIVAVSSLNDDENISCLKSSESKITSQSTNRSLEEIVISDEES